MRSLPLLASREPMSRLCGCRKSGANNQPAASAPAASAAAAPATVAVNGLASRNNNCQWAGKVKKHRRWPKKLAQENRDLTSTMVNGSGDGGRITKKASTIMFHRHLQPLHPLPFPASARPFVAAAGEGHTDLPLTQMRKNNRQAPRRKAFSAPILSHHGDQYG